MTHPNAGLTVSRMRRHMTYANVMATIAVFLGLGGSSYAVVKITGKDVKNGSLTGLDIKNGSLSGIDVRDGSLRATDFRQGDLPAGAPGIQGPKGDPGATKAIVRTSSGHGVQITSCLPGETATGGGGHSPDGYVIATGPASHPQAFFSVNGPPGEFNGSTTWESRAVKIDGSDADVTTWVVCVSP
jgi:hypothetical protein